MPSAELRSWNSPSYFEITSLIRLAENMLATVIGGGFLYGFVDFGGAVWLALSAWALVDAPALTSEVLFLRVVCGGPCLGILLVVGVDVRDLIIAWFAAVFAALFLERLWDTVMKPADAAESSASSLLDAALCSVVGGGAVAGRADEGGFVARALAGFVAFLILPPYTKRPPEIVPLASLVLLEACVFFAD